MRYLVFLLFPLIIGAASDFKAEKLSEAGVPIIRLTDTVRGVQVSIVPSLGNRAYQLAVHGKNLLYFPMDVAAFKAAEGKPFNGIPFLAPWGNRIPGGGFWANGKRYNFNTSLNNLSIHSDIAIHGMLAASTKWDVVEVLADQNSAHVTCKLQFWRYPDLLENWPFAHDYEMTYRLSAQGVEVSTTVRNLSAEPMPIVIGFHPYFQIPNVPRSEWSIHLPARKRVQADSNLVATGELITNDLPDQVSLANHTFDDGFTDLIRDADGFATFTLRAADKQIAVAYGPKYKVALIYAPPGQNFTCFEPMAAMTNGINLAHDGKYDELQMLAPNATWHESFWIRSSGF